uniref:AMP-binding protein n=1 Tax=Maribacter sp. 2-571 TaxID=3417569 RepID=UPI003D324BD3
ILPTDRVLQWSNLAFDGSTYDIYSTLLNGGCLYLIDGISASDPEALSRIILDNQVSVVFMTTALFNAFVDYDLEAFSSLRKLLFGGQQVSVPHVRRAYRSLGPGKLIHVYGPTETTVYASYYEVDTEPVVNVPIGRPLSNTGIYVLNGSLGLSGLGMVGELCIGGDGVSPGYLNHPQQTMDRFISNPFDASGGGSLYRTGDLVRWL